MRAISSKTILSTTNTLTTSGDNTVISAPGAGRTIVVTSLFIQLEGTTATTVIVKEGSNAIRRVLCQNQGDGLLKDWNADAQRPLAANSALVLNLSTTSNIGYTIEYYTTSA